MTKESSDALLWGVVIGFMIGMVFAGLALP